MAGGSGARERLLVSGGCVLTLDRTLGDLEQGDVLIEDGRISAVEQSLDGVDAQVIDASELSTDVVRVGVTVNVKDEKTGSSDKYTIVGSAEASPADKKLSNESPVGKALMGRKKGESVEVALPSGKKRTLKITKIDVAA